MEFYFKPTALRDLKKLPKEVQKRILRKLDFYFKSDNPFLFAKSLKDKTLGTYRFRIGDYRVIFDADSVRGVTKAIILAIGHRKDLYH
jgi:mRNA interferase RelE/StbE